MSIERKLGAGFTLVVAIVLGTVGVNYLTGQQVKEQHAWTSHTLEMLAELETTLGLMTDLETGPRGFAITGQEAFLEPYRYAQGRIGGQIRHIKELAGDNPNQQRQVSELERLVAAKLEHCNRIVGLAKEQGLEAARRLVATGRGKAPMDAIRKVIAEMGAEEKSLLRQQQMAAEASERILGWTLTALRTLLVLASLGFYVLAVRYVRVQAASEENLKAHARRLEVLRELDRAILEARSPEEIVVSALRQMVHILPYWGASVTLFDFAANEEIIVAFEGHPELLATFPRGSRFSLDREGDLAAMKENLVSAVSDIDAIPNPSLIVQDLYKLGMRAYARVPLMAHGTLLGLLNLGSNETYSISEERIQVALTIAGPLALALEQAILRSKIEQQSAELERRVVERTAELQASNQELDSFSYTVAHDLRAPIRAINSFSNILLREYASQIPPDALDCAQEIARNGNKMGRLIDDLLAYSRLGNRALSIARVSMTTLVKDVLEAVKPEMAERDVDIKMGELPECRGDPALLREVWLNLLGNAIKYTRNRERAEIEIDSIPDPQGTIYFVSDNGVGFDMRYSDKLFKVFERLHGGNEFEGTGVGLAIVDRIIQRHGGRVWAKAEVDKGATFYFTMGETGGGHVG